MDREQTQLLIVSSLIILTMPAPKGDRYGNSIWWTSTPLRLRIGMALMHWHSIIAKCCVAFSQIQLSPLILILLLDMVLLLLDSCTVALFTDSCNQNCSQLVGKVTAIFHRKANCLSVHYIVVE